ADDDAGARHPPSQPDRHLRRAQWLEPARYLRPQRRDHRRLAGGGAGEARPRRLRHDCRQAHHPAREHRRLWGMTTTAPTAGPFELRVPVEYHRLANGLRVVLSPDRAAPIITVAV